MAVDRHSGKRRCMADRVDAMSEPIKRHRLKVSTGVTTGQVYAELVECENEDNVGKGPWVQYDDHVAALAALIPTWTEARPTAEQWLTALSLLERLGNPARDVIQRTRLELDAIRFLDNLYTSGPLQPTREAGDE